MEFLQKKFIINHLKNLGLKKKDNILLYANLTTFGFKSKTFPKFLIQQIKKIVTQKGTIIMPLYNFNLNEKIKYSKYNIYKKINKNLLYNFFFYEKNKKISNSIIHRHIGIGYLSKYLTYDKHNKSFGYNSNFNFFLKKKFKLILLGCSPNEGATYLHQVENLAKVPYRKMIILRKKIFIRKNIAINYKYYARKNNNYVENFDSFFENYISRKKLKIQKNKYYKSFSITINDLHKLSLQLLKKDKYALVKKV